MKPKLIRTSTVATSLDVLLKGQLAFLQSHYEVIAVSGSDVHLRNVQEREGVRIIDIPMQRSISPLKDLISLWRLYVLFRVEMPSVVHSITPKAGLLSMAAAFFARVPIRVHTFTGVIFPSKTGLLQKLLIAMDKVLCLFATNIIPEGEGVKKDLINYKITNKPLKIIAHGNVNGIDLGYFCPSAITEAQILQVKDTLGIKLDDFIFIFVGRLVSDKGINELIQAFSKLETKYSSVKLMLVGLLESNLDPLLPETMEIMSRSKSIISIGYQVDVRPFFAVSDVLVFPSYREGFPNVVIQAGAMAKPSIVTDINGCNEIIDEGVNGTIIPVKDSRAIYKAMERMIEDQDWKSNMQKHAREMIETRYDQTLVWNTLLQEYKNF